MTSQLQTDKDPFQFHIIFLGMNPIKDDAPPTVRKPIYKDIRTLYLDLDSDGNRRRLASVPKFVACFSL
jgi:hypothetical protein